VECKFVRDPRELGRRFENQVLDALAVNTRCGGVTVIRDLHQEYDPDWLVVYRTNRKIKDQKPYWDLFLDYNPGLKVHGWTLFPQKAGGAPAGPMVSGEGDTAKIADQICAVIKRQGASIR
jgi:hypothetical protein